ncbi:hypothetical protein Sta7437_4340 [Stanieria cyanosphaera PCC 7437]|uniref:Uncharacterized protein n=1 Tax=Stanieria cyanosphaera (strain ATCC 29371 / PCC 7437) TaxID=111780 RepID=K9Y0I4_STAC7|nr:hypothetical protein [Stanieria cyanosphaera]AFZ37809.1 hypothetical protein Sta7437_4340 [Stanieria cyanosphaera PCC 7437]
MPKPTQAHLDRTIKKNQPLELKQKTLSQMQYYMGAKLIEVGIDPQSVIYRWSVKHKEDEQICTLSAFWGESRKKLLSGEEPLTGAELIDCARANASSGIKKAAQLCGYSTDVSGFQTALKQTSQEMGLSIESLKNLLNN